MDKVKKHNRLVKKFNKLIERLDEDTEMSSNPMDTYNHPAYDDILALGKDVIPLMLEDMQAKKHNWFYALKTLTGISPVKNEDKGTSAGCRNAWLEWGKQQGYIK